MRETPSTGRSGRRRLVGLALLPVLSLVPLGCTSGPDAQGLKSSYSLPVRDQVAAQVCQGRSLETTLAQLARPHREDYGRPYLVGFADSDGSARDGRALAEAIRAAYRDLAAGPPAAPGDGQPRALALIGDHYHPPDYIRPPLEAAMKAAGVPTDFLYDVTWLNTATLRRYRLLIVLRDGMNWPDPGTNRPQWWMTDAQEHALIAFIRAGGGFLALHNANALKPWAETANPAPILRVMGSQYDSHGAPREGYRVRVLKRDHPVTRGVADFTATGERHRPRPLAGEMVRLLESSGDGETCLAGYARTEGKGRVVYLAFGHNREVIDLPDVQRLLVNAARWCCRMSE